MRIISVLLSLSFFVMTQSSSLLASFNFIDRVDGPQSLTVSLLTVDVGSGLEKRYGHSILRVSDSKLDDEVLLNWGTFDWNQPYFIPRFLLGRLPPYFVSESNFNSFIYNYHEYEKRSAFEDTINLSLKQKDKLLRILSKKLQPDQIYFKYDFFYNNCSSILRDILNDVLNGKLKEIYDKVPAKQNLRAYVRNNLNEWAFVTFFLDIMLNSDVDTEISAWVEMFHPLMLLHYLGELPQFDDQGHEIEGTKLLSKHHLIVQGDIYPSSSINMFLVVSIISFLMLGFFIVLIRKKPVYACHSLSSFCIGWGFLSGLLGTLLLAGWMISNHHMLYHNANLLVFLPPDFAFLTLGLQYKKQKFQYNSAIFYYIIAKMIALLIFVTMALLNIFTQDVSNVLMYLTPVQGLFLGLILFLFFQARKQRG